MKMVGSIKWFDTRKKYGYIIGADENEYFFQSLNCVNINEDFHRGDKVLFIPEFKEMEYANQVERVENNG